MGLESDVKLKYAKNCDRNVFSLILLAGVVGCVMEMCEVI